MNYKNCARCSQPNPSDMRFCQSCGTEFTTTTSVDLPPTVFGGQMPHFQPSDFQAPPVSPPNQFQNQPNFGAPNSPPVVAAPKKSKGLKFLILGVVGVLLLVALGVFGKFVYDKTIGARLYEQKLEKEYREKQLSASRLTAKELLPERITRNAQTVNRGQVVDKTALAEIIKTKMPQLNGDIKDIDDAAAALYAGADKKQAALQVFKYNSPEQAKNACRKIGEEMIKNKNNFVKEPRFGFDYRPGFCGISEETKNGEYVSVNSLYGFLYLSTGYKDYAEELSSEVWRILR